MFAGHALLEKSPKKRPYFAKETYYFKEPTLE
jgi:hypothetical protein